MPEIGQGIFEAGQGIAQGIQQREERRYRDRVFDEQRRQFDAQEQRAQQKALMEAAANLRTDYITGIKEGTYPEDQGNQILDRLQPYVLGQGTTEDLMKAMQGGTPTKVNYSAPTGFPGGGPIRPPFPLPAGGMLPGQPVKPVKSGTSEQLEQVSRQSQGPMRAPLPMTVSKDAARAMLTNGVPTQRPPIDYRSVARATPEQQINMFKRKPFDFASVLTTAMGDNRVNPKQAEKYYEVLATEGPEAAAEYIPGTLREKPLTESEKFEYGYKKSQQKLDAMKMFTVLAEQQRFISSEMKDANDRYIGVVEEYAKIGQNVPAEIITLYEKQKAANRKKFEAFEEHKMNLNEQVLRPLGTDLYKLQEAARQRKSVQSVDFFQAKVEELKQQDREQIAFYQSLSEEQRKQLTEQKRPTSYTSKTQNEINDEARAFAWDRSGTDPYEVAPVDYLAPPPSAEDEHRELAEKYESEGMPAEQAEIRALEELLPKYPELQEFYNQLVRQGQIPGETAGLPDSEFRGELEPSITSELGIGMPTVTPGDISRAAGRIGEAFGRTTERLGENLKSIGNTNLAAGLETAGQRQDVAGQLQEIQSTFRTARAQLAQQATQPNRGREWLARQLQALEQSLKERYPEVLVDRVIQTEAK